jgi:hypothetical protein
MRMVEQYAVWENDAILMSAEKSGTKRPLEGLGVNRIILK